MIGQSNFEKIKRFRLTLKNGTRRRKNLWPFACYSGNQVATFMPKLKKKTSMGVFLFVLEGETAARIA